ncbi:uncharacterized protein LOC116189249 [Punica granatum]|uniref:Uncharacterized protein LOC116189249 n=1 Tax=Punica granatum TaxID=22663 RepID=A0A6P8BYL5_PUNGR|nr:uncharacterized protein LOC116189249 [Punica granatum]XP_031374683.1 uncharacterized protein LOC116189249 [Punica granatum]XP_031374685.1 uncharacterized protein LOC116189249 [Punica granatum]XP_031374686.1 uncharacterized protein LOC116189249 [Punica granatum]
MATGDLEIKTDKQSRKRTALHYAVVSGSLPIVRTLVEKNGKLMEIVDDKKYSPLHEAAYYFESKEVVRYLISKMPDVTPPYKDSPFFADDCSKGAELIARLVDSRAYDICLQLLVKYPILATATTYCGKGMLNELSLRPSGFLSGSKLGYLGRCIYKIIPVESNGKPRDSSSKGDLENQRVKEQPTLLRHLTQVMHWINGASWTAIEQLVPWVKRIKDEKYEHTFLKIACKEMSGWSQKDISSFFQKFPYFRAAAQNGAVEFITTFFKDFPHLVRDGESILGEAVLHRQEKVFNLFIEGTATMKHLAADYDSVTKDNILHKAARLAPYPQLSSVACPALQMQRELQWFRAVEDLLNPTQRFYRNQKGETPREIFTIEHRKLLSDAVLWMKDTSNSCMVVTALIATVLFSSVFAVPGGNVEGKGIPLFLQEKVFILFAASDAVGLFSSTTSILMFLSILTARYAEEDFLYSLPKRLILGFASLFLAIASMMVAFGATLYMVLRERFKWIFIPIIVITSIPVLLFVKLQLPLFFYMVRSTMVRSKYGSGIFHHKKIW